MDITANNRFEDQNLWNHHKRIVRCRCIDELYRSVPEYLVCLNGEWSGIPECISRYTTDKHPDNYPPLAPVLPLDYSYQVQHYSGETLLQIVGPHRWTDDGRLLRQESSYIFPHVDMCTIEADQMSKLFIGNVNHRGHIVYRNRPRHSALRLNHGEEVTYRCLVLADMVGPKRSQCQDGHIDVPICYERCQQDLLENSGMSAYFVGAVVGENSVFETGMDLYTGSIRTHIYAYHNQEIDFTCEGTMAGPSRSRCADGHIIIPGCYNVTCTILKAKNLILNVEVLEAVDGDFRYDLKEDMMYVKHGKSFNISCDKYSTKFGPAISRCDDGNIIHRPVCHAKCLVEPKTNYESVYSIGANNSTHPITTPTYVIHGSEVIVTCAEGTSAIPSTKMRVQCEDGIMFLPHCADCIAYDWPNVYVIRKPSEPWKYLHGSSFPHYTTTQWKIGCVDYRKKYYTDDKNHNHEIRISCSGGRLRGNFGRCSTLEEELGRTLKRKLSDEESTHRPTKARAHQYY